jgi:hypothetical protein
MPPVFYAPLDGRELVDDSAWNVTGFAASTNRVRPCAGPRDRAGTKFAGYGLTFPAQSRLSIATTGELSVAVWLRPDMLLFPRAEQERSGYCPIISKGAAPGQYEWAIRMYSSDNRESPSRQNRISAYAFNPQGGQGVGTYFQMPLVAGEWIHVAAVYSTLQDQIQIWFNGIPINSSLLQGDTRYNVRPTATDGPLCLACRGTARWRGALSTLHVYDHALGNDEVQALYEEEPA